MAPLPNPEPPDVVLHALRRLCDRVVGLLGADASAWNGEVESLRRSDRILGTASWEGSLGLREDMLEALERMHAWPGAPWDQRSRDEFLTALKTAVHEFTHFARNSSGESYEESAEEYQRWATKVLEEGATEASTQEWFRLCARDFEAVAPGIASASAPPAYRQFTPAVRELAAYVAGLHGIKPRTVLSILNEETPRQKFARLAQLVLDAKLLWRQIPEDERLDCRDRVVQAIRDVFWRNSDWAKDRDNNDSPATEDASGRSRIMGMQAVAAVERARLEIEARYGSPGDLPIPWEVAAARFDVIAAKWAGDFAQRRPIETQLAAAQWLRRAKRSMHLEEEVQTAGIGYPAPSLGVCDVLDQTSLERSSWPAPPQQTLPQSGSRPRPRLPKTSADRGHAKQSSMGCDRG